MYPSRVQLTPGPSLEREGSEGNKEEMIRKTARLLRKNQTKAEAALWVHLRNRGLENRKFVRQYPFTVRELGRYRFVVVDFYCHAEKLGIELDGPIHDGRIEIDKHRQMLLEKFGIRLIRFRNEEVLGDLKHVLNDITRNFSFPSPSLSREGPGVS